MKQIALMIASFGLCLSAFAAPRGFAGSRVACTRSLTSPACATYCHQNEYDVVCGDLYRTHHYRPAPPSYGDSPYPWARSGGGFCDQNPYNIGCQQDWWSYGYGRWGW